MGREPEERSECASWGKELKRVNQRVKGGPQKPARHSKMRKTSSATGVTHLKRKGKRSQTDLDWKKKKGGDQVKEGQPKEGTQRRPGNRAFEFPKGGWDREKKKERPASGQFYWDLGGGGGWMLRERSTQGRQDSSRGVTSLHYYAIEKT